MQWVVSPRKVVNRYPILSVRETELWNDLELVLSFSHEFKTPLQLVEKMSPKYFTTNSLSSSF